MLDSDGSPLVVCYKCNQIVNPLFFSHLINHLDTEHHASSSLVWYRLKNKLPECGYFPRPDMHGETITPTEAEAVDKFLVSQSLFYSQRGKGKKARKQVTQTLYNKLMSVSKNIHALETAHPEMAVVLRSIYEF